jgi:hypothetical protein
MPGRNRMKSHKAAFLQVNRSGKEAESLPAAVDLPPPDWADPGQRDLADGYAVMPMQDVRAHPIGVGCG